MTLNLSIDPPSENAWESVLDHLLRSLWGAYGVSRQMVPRLGFPALDHPPLPPDDLPLGFTETGAVAQMVCPSRSGSDIVSQLGVRYRERIAATDWTLEVWEADFGAEPPRRYAATVSVSDRAESILEHDLHWSHIVDTLAQEIAPRIYPLDPRRGVSLYTGEPPFSVGGLVPLPLFDRPDRSDAYQTGLLGCLVSLLDREDPSGSGSVFSAVGGESPCQCPYCKAPLLSPVLLPRGLGSPVWGGGNLGWVHPGCMESAR